MCNIFVNIYIMMFSFLLFIFKKNQKETDTAVEPKAGMGFSKGSNCFYIISSPSVKLNLL